jgi:DNA-binding NarL/FixJ family response regulator
MILIADDSAPMRRTIKSMLAESAHLPAGQAGGFLECSDGSEALELYARHRPAWVLMDIRMHPMDGITATRRLKSTHPSARIIIVTDYNDPQLRAEANEAGAYAYVLKDDLSELVNIITQVDSGSG